MPGKFGIEIEFVGPYERLHIALSRTGLLERGWYLGHDGSVSGRLRDTHEYGEGYELKSPPMLADESTSWEMLKLALRTCREAGGIINRTCGLHVHVDATGMTVDNVRRLLRGYYGAQETINSIIPRSRHAGRNSYCGVPNAAQLENILRAPTLREMSNRGQRYTNVNLTSYPVHGTIEFRQHSGSLNYRKISSWARFVLAAFETAKSDREFGVALRPLVASLALRRRDRRYWRTRARTLAPAQAA